MLIIPIVKIRGWNMYFLYTKECTKANTHIKISFCALFVETFEVSLQPFAIGDALLLK